jgi:hypothetical protein
MLSEACGGKCVKKSSVFEWQKRFKVGRENVEDDERSLRPRSHKTDDIAEGVQNLILSDV